MRIIIDLRPLMDGRVSGVTVYIKQFLKELLDRSGAHEFILFWNSFSHVNHRFDFLEEFLSDRVKVVSTRIPNILLNFSLRFFGWPCLDKLIQMKLGDKKKIDLFFLPDLRPVCLSNNVRLVTTFHDLSFVHVPGSFSFKTRMWHTFINPLGLARMSDRIIAVSHFTKSDLIDVYKIDGQNISVVHHGVSLPEGCTDTWFNISRRYDLPEKYLLTLSTLEPRKNLVRLMEAFDRFRRVHADISLVVAGSFQSDVFSAFNLKQVPGVYFTGFVEEVHKLDIYSHALGFVYVSEYEGFGLPVLEAALASCQLLVSNNTSVNEIAPTEAVRVSPFSVDEIALGLEKLLLISSDQTIRRRFREYALRFTWKKCVDETIGVFEDVLK